MHYTDQLNRTVLLPNPPERIISLVPSQTELLVDLGLEEKIVGVTKFCVRPESIRKAKTIVGGTKNYHFEVIDALRPDLIIGNKEENYRDEIEKLAKKYPVWMSDVYSLSDSLRMISEVGILTGASSRADYLIQKILTSFSEPIPKQGTCVYLIWQNPCLVAGKKTFIDSMLSLAGFENLILEERYPEVSVEKLRDLSPDFLLLSSEPFPFKEKHLTSFQYIFPKSQPILVEGELFSWYGSRLLHSAPYFRRLSAKPKNEFDFRL